MRANPGFGLYNAEIKSRQPIYARSSPSESSTISECITSTGRGGLKHSDWESFLFHETKPASSLGLLGGAAVEYYHLDEPDDEISALTVDSYKSFLVNYCSFVDGFDRGIRLPIIYLLKTKYMLTQALAFTAFGVSLSPWLAKPLIAVVTDSIPLFGLRRKPYLILSASLNALSLGIIGFLIQAPLGSFLLPLALLTFRTVCRATTGSVIQGMLLEDCQSGSQARTSVLMSQYHTAHRLGQLVSVAASGYMLLHASLTPVIFGSMAILHFGSVALSSVLHEEPHPPHLSLGGDSVSALSIVGAKVEELRTVAVGDVEFQNLLKYSFFAMADPTYEARMAYYLLDHAGLDIWSVSLVTSAQTVAATIAPTIYTIWFKNSPDLLNLMRKFTWFTLPASLLPLLITANLSPPSLLIPIAALSGFLLTLSTDLQMMPVNVLVAKLATPGLEGACFSLFTVSEGIGRVASNVFSGVVPAVLGAAASNGYANMSLYVVACSAFQLSPLMFANPEPIETIERVMPRTTYGDNVEVEREVTEDVLGEKVGRSRQETQDELVEDEVFQKFN